MKKFLLSLLGIIVIVGVLAGAGLVGYRYGLTRNATSATGDDIPALRGNGFDWDRMPMHNFNRYTGPQFMERGPGGFHMLGRGGFGFFAPLRFLIQVAVWALLIWLVYKFFTGWRLTLTPPPAAPLKAEVVEPESKNQQE